MQVNSAVYFNDTRIKITVYQYKIKNKKVYSIKRLPGRGEPLNQSALFPKIKKMDNKNIIALLRGNYHEPEETIYTLEDGELVEIPKRFTDKDMGRFSELFLDMYSPDGIEKDMGLSHSAPEYSKALKATLYKGFWYDVGENLFLGGDDIYDKMLVYLKENYDIVTNKPTLYKVEDNFMTVNIVSNLKNTVRYMNRRRVDISMDANRYLARIPLFIKFNNITNVILHNPVYLEELKRNTFIKIFEKPRKLTKTVSGGNIVGDSEDGVIYYTRVKDIYQYLGMPKDHRLLDIRNDKIFSLIVLERIYSSISSRELIFQGGTIMVKEDGEAIQKSVGLEQSGNKTFVSTAEKTLGSLYRDYPEEFRRKLIEMGQGGVLRLA